jgi:hypothetical protein
MHMRSARTRDAVHNVADDVAQAGLCIDSVSDVLAGAAVRKWRHDHPEYGWVALALLVAAADYTGSRTMSDVFRNASRSRIGRPLMILGWGTLTAHLFGIIPSQYDPFHKLTYFRRDDDGS